ncbi:MAG: hypothetical protein KF850_01815 [Labilithrix sp.]|nr:hypothetical protein [Labilithrix sp.]
MNASKFYAVVAVGVVAVALGTFALREDKGEPDYKRCLAEEAKGDVVAASSACVAARAADPNSKSGRAAAAKLGEMAPAVDKAKKAKEEADAKAAEAKRVADEAAAKARAEARAQAAKEARRKVERRYDGTTRDGQCIDRGLPDYRWEYEGGSRDEIDLVASDDGCQHLFPGRSDFLLFKVFCCPRAPKSFPF